MEKALALAKKISKHLDKNWIPELEENNLHSIFSPIYLSPYNIRIQNAIIVYIIYAYDNQSQWINLNADRTTDKIAILKGLEIDPYHPPFDEILYGNVTEISDVINDYLAKLTNWKWRTAMACIDLHQQSLKTISQPIVTVDDLEIEKIKKERSANLREGIRNREVADNLLKEMRSEYVKSDRATQQDFGFDITDEKKLDITSWRDFIRHTKPEWESRRSTTNGLH